MFILGKERNFRKVSKESSTTGGVPYDYLSVMHYGKNAFSNGNGSTIITKDPKFQDVIGQRLEVSPSDIQELNIRYKCSKCFRFLRNISTYEMFSDCLFQLAPLKIKGAT